MIQAVLTTREQDATFYQVVHRLLQEQEALSGRERRQSDRRPYECVQLLAFYDGRRRPAQTDFLPVQCYDLSPGGFSFFMPAAPQHREVIVALGAVPFSFYLAKVLHVRPIEREGRKAHLIGCRFEKRIAAATDLP